MTGHDKRLLDLVKRITSGTEESDHLLSSSIEIAEALAAAKGWNLDDPEPVEFSRDVDESGADLQAELRRLREENAKLKALAQIDASLTNAPMTEEEAAEFRRGLELPVSEHKGKPVAERHPAPAAPPYVPQFQDGKLFQSGIVSEGDWIIFCCLKILESYVMSIGERLEKLEAVGKSRSHEISGIGGDVQVTLTEGSGLEGAQVK